MCDAVYLSPAGSPCASRCFYLSGTLPPCLKTLLFILCEAEGCAVSGSFVTFMSVFCCVWSDGELASASSSNVYRVNVKRLQCITSSALADMSQMFLLEQNQSCNQIRSEISQSVRDTQTFLIKSSELLHIHFIALHSYWMTTEDSFVCFCM